MTTASEWRKMCAELLGIFEKYDDESNLGGIIWDMKMDGNDLLERARAALAQPEPEGPTDEELDELAEEYLDWNADGIRGYARAVLARYGRPAIEPVPVSERLPGPEDTTDRNECWYWHPGEECWDMVPVVTGTLDEWTHWLPHWALPVPKQEGEQ